MSTGRHLGHVVCSVRLTLLNSNMAKLGVGRSRRCGGVVGAGYNGAGGGATGPGCSGALRGRSWCWVQWGSGGGHRPANPDLP